MLKTTALVVFLLIFMSAPAAANEAEACSQAEVLAGTCPTVEGEIRDDKVEIIGEVDVPGSRGGGTGGGGTGGGGGAGATQPPRTLDPWLVVIRDPYYVVGPVKISDLVSFRPTPGVDHMEPNGWMIVDLDTNFYARSGVQVQSGQLLGEQASVRFTPVRYHWYYGDGTSAHRGTPGATWRASGISEFDPTPTSHVYTDAGTYYIDLTIDFAAEYRFAGGEWTSIAGVIPVPANRLVATAGGAKTVLVEEECTRNPSGPGC